MKFCFLYSKILEGGDSANQFIDREVIKKEAATVAVEVAEESPQRRE